MSPVKLPVTILLDTFKPIVNWQI